MYFLVYQYGGIVNWVDGVVNMLCNNCFVLDFVVFVFVLFSFDVFEFFVDVFFIDCCCVVFVEVVEFVVLVCDQYVVFKQVCYYDCFVVMGFGFLLLVNDMGYLVLFQFGVCWFVYVWIVLMYLGCIWLVWSLLYCW